jgi:hypothetical protein
MSSPSTSVTMPDWLQGALQPFLQQATQRYSQFAKKGERKVGDDFWQQNARNVLGPSPAERRALDMAGGLGSVGGPDLNYASQLYRRAMGGNDYLNQAGGLLSGEGKDSNLARSAGLLDEAGRISREQVTGKNLASDPAIAAANTTFRRAMMPMIQNQAALAGLGRSNALTNATAAQQAQTLLPLIQGGLQREESGINRRLGTTMETANQLFGRDMTRAGALQGLGRGDQEAMYRTAGAMQGVAGERMARQLQQIQQLAQQGGNIRGIRQEGKDAKFNDLMRRFGAYEQSLQGPLGMVGGMMGSQTNKF